MNLFTGLQQRRVVPEIMDQPDLDSERHVHALQSLRRINSVSLTSTLVWTAIDDYLSNRTNSVKPLRILDIATGGGDVPIALSKKLQRSSCPVEIHGCDVHSQAVRFAEATAGQSGANVRFFQHDVIKQGIPEGYDILLCGLFLHHLELDDTLVLLQGMANACKELLVINDLERSVWHVALAYVACYSLTRSDVVRFDGPASVRAGYRLPEIRAIAGSAGLTEARFTRHWPFRWRMVWRKS
ncbi:MAG: hypothetical protein AMXMBFR84_14060 [Candidatus Hydrogenedentota bacterium]